MITNLSFFLAERRHWRLVSPCYPRGMGVNAVMNMKKEGGGD